MDRISFKEKELAQKFIECAFKIHSIFGKGVLGKGHMNEMV